MKLILMLALVILPLGVMAQSNTIETPPEPRLDWWANAIALASLSEPDAKLTQDGATYTGIGVQLIQAEQPLQLLNPLAPKRYGTGEQNVVFDLFTKQPFGLKLFSFNF